MQNIVKFICCIALLACGKAKEPAVIYTAPPANGPVKTWLALGDSYTIGQSVTESERFPNQTANILKQSGINIGTPDYIATTGWTTSNLMDAIQAQNAAKHDVVSLLIGVNDEYQRHDTTGYRQRFTDLLVRSVQLANGKKENVFVLSIPDYSVTPFASGGDTAQVRKEIDWFNTINKQVTNAYQCPYLDITPSTREARNNPALIANDGLHPSGMEYKKWAVSLAPMMLPVLK
jgi:lysophospholipase L1-like esterase